MKSEERFDLTVKYTFNTAQDRQSFLNVLKDIMNMPPRDTEFRSHFTACKLCGISRTYQTLGSGIPGSGSEKDQCHPAYTRGCEARQKKNQIVLAQNEVRGGVSDVEL